MDYAIIAAGNGSRLHNEGCRWAKPLVKVGGERLIDRLIRIFIDNGARSIRVIINENMPEVKQYLEDKNIGVPLHIIYCTTANSLQSLVEILRRYPTDELCLSTIDSVFDEEEFARYVSQFEKQTTTEALLATTRYIDDEKPLWIATDAGGNIVRFANHKDRETTYISGGIYCLRHRCLKLAHKAAAAGLVQMRQYQQYLIDNHCRVKAYPMGKIVDIDHVADIAKAESLIANLRKSHRVLVLKRNPRYSPHSTRHDNDIINAVSNRLIAKGYTLSVKDEDELLHGCQRYNYVLSMARNPQVLDLLETWQQAGTVVINSPESCRNCHRSRLAELLSDEVPTPTTLIIPTHSPMPNIEWAKPGKYWIKRADFQTVEPNDVAMPRSTADANDILANYHSRGILHATLSRHIEGSWVKFYGVCDTNFFHYYYPQQDTHGHSIPHHHQAFDHDELKNMATTAAERTGLCAYGGDAIVDNKGGIYIIDLNDFPSYAPCRHRAAGAIARAFDRRVRVSHTDEDEHSFRRSLKSDDTEEPLDIKFYRPLGYRIAKAAEHRGITPNAITIVSIFLGVAAGLLFFPPSLGWNCLGMLLLVCANVLDSADGQLARLTNHHTRTGRILDGLAGDLWFITIYISICLRLQVGGYGWWIWLLGATAGACHILHAAMADYYRNVHLFFVKGNNGSEHDNSRDLDHEIQRMKADKEWLHMAALWFYRNYTWQQERLSPHMSRLTSELKKRYVSSVPPAIAGEFRRRNKPYLKYTNILQFNTRTLFLFACLIVGLPWLYFVFDLVVMNAVLVYLIRKEEGLANSLMSQIPSQP